MLTEIRADFGLTTVEAASLISAAFISLVWRPDAGRNGRSLRTAAGHGHQYYSLSVGTLACGFATGFTTLFIARLVIGMGMAGNMDPVRPMSLKAGQAAA